ncbi:hypothetical protein EYF80_045793 [Liparis tanakae]|uniref:Uncharacterized protein n=1 Tax=Liparis tanakae TaxID=230148 RepID=A0A4Z2FS97_9TELE|nr:hypothetical protein EYF80_045793 [Liparis tanakae]
MTNSGLNLLMRLPLRMGTSPPKYSRALAMPCWHKSCRLATRCSTRTTYSAGPHARNRRESL